MVQRRDFPTGGAVGAEDLVGREHVLKELFERVYTQGNSVVLSAPRQTGKTSVVAELVRRVRKAKGMAVSVDCSTATSADDLAELIAAKTYDEASGLRNAFARLGDLVRNVPVPTLYQTDADIALAFHSPQRQMPTTQKLAKAFALADRIAEEKKVRTVVVYDELPTVRRLSPRVLDQLRAELQHANKQTSYIFMGSETGMLNALFKDRRRMTFRLGVPLELPAPTDTEWVRYIEDRFRTLGLPLAQSEAQHLVTFTGAHPRDLMEACQHLLTLRKLDPSTARALEVAEEKTYVGLQRNFELVWDLIDEPRGTRLTAVRIATGQPVYGRGREAKATKRTVDKLMNEGIVRQLGRGRFEFTEPLFAEHVRRISSRS